MAAVAFELPYLGAVTYSALFEAALAAGSIALSMMMRQSAPTPQFRSMSSAWGDTFPIVYNNFRIAGQVIQAGPVTQYDAGGGSFGGISGAGGSVGYNQTIAVAFCEGPKNIGRIWADNQVIYDPRPIQQAPFWQPHHIYSAGDIVLPTAGGTVQFTASNDGESGGSEPAWNNEQYAVTYDGTIAWIASHYVQRTFVGKQYNYTLRIYTGSEGQLPDASLEELAGVGFQPAYRGLVYIVLESFGLAKYGNRIPNFEAEIVGHTFIEDADLYGPAFGTNAITSPFLTDTLGNIYGVGGDNNVTNIKTLATVTKTNAQIQADAASFGFSSALASWSLLPLVGRYVIGVSCTNSPESINVILYAINTVGQLVPAGVKSYPFTLSGSTLIQNAIQATVRLDTGEVMIVYGDFATLNINIFLADTINALIGNWMLQPEGSRIVRIAEITGDYAATPQPYIGGGNTCSFVSTVLYVTLNKAVMDWHAAHSGGVGFNSFYKSLQPGNPNGVQLRIDTFSDGVSGVLTYTYGGPTIDFAWPFLDEGLDKAGNPGNTTSPTYDCWSVPAQVQAENGYPFSVWFARGYSDALNEIGGAQFQGNDILGWLQVDNVSGAPFDGSFSSPLSEPRIAFIVDSIYLSFQSGSDYFAKVGGFLPTNASLADICADVSRRVGLTVEDYDYSGLESVSPLGCAIITRAAARSFLEALQPAFFYDLVDIGEKIVGTLRSNGSLLLFVPEDDLGAGTDPATIVDRLSTVRSPDLEIPKDLSVNFYDYQNDYVQGSQNSKRNQVTQYSSGNSTISLPIVMTPADAANAAQRMLYLLWVERETKKLTLPLDYILLTPSDVIAAERNGQNHFLRISKATLDPSMVINVEGVSEDFGVYSLDAPGGLPGGGGGTINPVQPPVLAVLDTATLQSPDLQTPGVYLAGCSSVFGGGWDSEIVQESQDDSNFSTVATLMVQAAMGNAKSVLGNCARWTVFDRVNTLDVTLLNGVLGNAAESDMIANFTNIAWLSNGEIVQFATAEFLGGSSWRLSDLLRGRFGTETFIGTATGKEQFVMLNPFGMGNVSYSPSDIGSVRYWQGVNDAPPDGGNSGVQTLTMVTRRLLPWAPYHMRGARDGPGNLTVTGLRRMRWRGRPLWHPPETDTPVAMSIDVYSGPSVVRTLTATLSVHGSGIIDPSTFEAYYAELDQVADFGSPQASVSIKAYELNAVVGRGYGGSATV